MNDIRTLYQEVIIDHGTKPRHFGNLKEPSCSQCGHNPLCGDSIILQLSVDDDHTTIEDIAFKGEGCAISMASTSLMSEAVKGKPINHAHSLISAMKRMLLEGDQSEETLASLSKLSVLSGVADYPARVKCATLAWHTLEAALAGNSSTVTTE